MSRRGQVEAQQRFYDSREHSHLRPQDADFYAENVAQHLADAVGLGPGDRVVELGAGFGRFTFPLLEHCGSLLAVDLTRRVLDDLEATKRERAIPDDRCRVLCRDVDELDAQDLDGRVDCVVGFFFLHHLPDFAGSIERIFSLLAPGGRVAFVEPNRRNPLFVAQVIGCRDMTWKDERGMFQLSGRKIEDAYRHAGFEEIRTESFGFFPPQLVNRFSLARSLERRLEQMALLRGVLPFLIGSARNGGARNGSARNPSPAADSKS